MANYDSFIQSYSSYQDCQPDETIKNMYQGCFVYDALTSKVESMWCEKDAHFWNLRTPAYLG